jgi:iron complex transport system permease protein
VSVLAAPQEAPVVRTARRRTTRRRQGVNLALAALVVTAFLVRVLAGDYTVTFPDFLRILFGEQIQGATFIVMETKLPRAVLAVLAGGAFGLSGAIFQTTLRNPLASPDIIGVNMGASAAAVFAIVSLGLRGTPVAVAAMVGAVAVSVVVRLVAGSHGGYRIVLVGVGLAALLQSAVQYLFTRANLYDAQTALVWLTGNLNAADWPTIRQTSVALMVLLPLTWWVAESLRMTELGDDTAAGLGVSGRRTDVLLLLAVLVAAVAVAATGPIVFAGFLAGPISRALNRGRTTLVGAFLTGAAIVTAADYVGAYAIAGVNLPVGVVTGAVGAPFLLWLLASGRTGRRVG